MTDVQDRYATYMVTVNADNKRMCLQVNAISDYAAAVTVKKLTGVMPMHESDVMRIGNYYPAM